MDAPRDRFISLLFINSVLSCLVLQSHGEPDFTIPPGREVIFSECCLTPRPGTHESWVELYNRSQETVDLSRVQIVCNDEVVASFPDSFSLPAKALFLLRFTSKNPGGWEDEEKRSNCLVAHTGGGVRPSGETASRTAGYLALVKDEDEERTLLDFVRWGWKMLPEDATYLKWAETIGAWHNSRSRPVYIGLSPSPGEPTLPADPIAISRYSFVPRSDTGAVWLVLPLQRATPGTGNTAIPAPTLMGAVSGQTFYRKMGIGFRDQGLSWSRDLDWTWVAQLAEDPHFEHILSTVTTRGGSCTFECENLPDDVYYMRVQWRSARAMSPWSEAVCCRLLATPKSTAPHSEEAQGRLKDDPALPPTAVRELDLLFGEDRLEKGQAGEKKKE